jgi:hypothetical protein
MVDRKQNTTNTDRFEGGLSVSESNALLNVVDIEKGHFLRQLDFALGNSLFKGLQDSNRVQNCPLLGLDDRHIMPRPDCDPQWIEELKFRAER